MELLQQHRMLWSTAMIGIDGFDRTHEERKSWYKRKRLPVLIDAVGTSDEIHKLIPLIRTIAPKCKILIIPVKMLNG
jgi:PII-like signaling protein